MPKEWLAQPVFLDMLKSMRVANRDKLLELEALAVEDAKLYYKHAVAILSKQIGARKPRHRVPVLYVINALVTHDVDEETRLLYSTRFAPEILTCIAAVLKCPPEHLPGVRRVLKRWRRLKVFDDDTLRKANEMVKAYRSDAGEHADRPSGTGALPGSSRGSSLAADEEAGNDSKEKDFEDEEYVLSEDDDDGDLDELNADPKAGTAERNETLPNSTPVPFKPSLDFAKSRVNKWPSKPVKKVEAPVEAEKKLETLGASTSANPPPPAGALSNPPPPVSVSGVNTNHNQLKNSQSNHKRPRYEPSPERTRSPPPRGDSRENRPRSGHWREDGRGDRRDRDGRREGRDSRDNRDNRESDRGRNRPASGSGHGRMNGGGRGGFSSSTPVDKWGDPIKSTNGDGQKRGRNTWDTRDRLVRSPARARSPRGRSRSRSPAKVRSLVRRSPSPEKIRSPVR